MLRTSLALALCLTFAGAVPVALAGNQPSASMVAPAGCASAVYSWANQRKATTAHIEIRPNGVLQSVVHSGPVSSSGSFALPATVSFVSGQHYTLLGYLTDAAGRSISQSGAAWWGYC
jgi:hypothetical protein